jgi:hypothetical protein
MVFVFLFISVLFTTKVDAYSDTVDIAKQQPFTIVEGENLTIYELSKLMTYKGQPVEVNSIGFVPVVAG